MHLKFCQSINLQGVHTDTVIKRTHGVRVNAFTFSPNKQMDKIGGGDIDNDL